MPNLTQVEERAQHTSHSNTSEPQINKDERNSQPTPDSNNNSNKIIKRKKINLNKIGPAGAVCVCVGQSYHQWGGSLSPFLINTNSPLIKPPSRRPSLLTFLLTCFLIIITTAPSSVHFSPPLLISLVHPPPFHPFSPFLRSHLITCTLFPLTSLHKFVNHTLCSPFSPLSQLLFFSRLLSSVSFQFSMFFCALFSRSFYPPSLFFFFCVCFLYSFVAGFEFIFFTIFFYISR